MPINRVKTLTLEQLNLDNNTQTFISTDYDSGITLYVENTSGMKEKDFIVLGKVGQEKSEIVQISSVYSSDRLILVAGAKFAHPANTNITTIDYDKIRVYRSATGLGGSYILLDIIDIQIDSLENSYQDWTAQVLFSYELAYYNSYYDIESSLSAEIPYSGFPFYSVKKICDRALSLLGDKDENLTDRDELTDWINEWTQACQFAIQGSDSPYYVDSVIINSIGGTSYDLSQYEIIFIFMIELSFDGGVTWTDFMTPKDFRFRDNPGAISQYEYQIGGQTMTVNPVIPTGVQIRMWFTTTPTILTSQTDVLPTPFKGHSAAWVDYLLMRANEKERKFSENAAHFKNKCDDFLTNREGVVSKIRQRIKQGGIAMATTFADDAEGY